MNKLMLVLFFLLFPLNLSAFPYVCLVEKSIGFVKSKTTEEWKPSIFSGDKEKYLVSKSKNPKYISEIKRFGKPYVVANCGDLSGSLTLRMFDAGYLHCDGNFNAKINVKTLKISLMSLGGYGVPPELNNRDSPFLSIGSCTPL